MRTDQNEKLCAASAKADWFSSSQIDPLSGKGRDNHSSLVQHGHRAVGAEGNLISGLRTERFSMIQYDFNIMIQSYPDTSTDLNISACSAALENHRASAISPAGHWSTNCNWCETRWIQCKGNTGVMPEPYTLTGLNFLCLCLTFHHEEQVAFSCLKVDFHRVKWHKCGEQTQTATCWPPWQAATRTVMLFFSL